MVSLPKSFAGFILGSVKASGNPLDGNIFFKCVRDFFHECLHPFSDGLTDCPIVCASIKTSHCEGLHKGSTNNMKTYTFCAALV